MPSPIKRRVAATGLFKVKPSMDCPSPYPDSERGGNQSRSHRLKEAWINRRMRKTACPVVWKGHGAQSPWPHPIMRGESGLMMP